MTTILKCKMCGGNIEIQEGSTVAKCRYCGSMMTLPRIDNDKKARLFNRANEYRLNNEFDKAYEAYKAISLEDTEEAEAYWGMLLAEYGIEYVEDPKTGERVPTCHRTQIQSIKASSNYKLACQHADLERRMMYEDEADAIDKIQKGIISVSTKEKPYDAFICYKETDDATGERTHDSVLAQDIYNELNKLGIRTFFSRITLEDKLGVDYEPYIYAALRSAKVMLVVTTSSEHCDAVWVKNEWMRFLRFMEEDSNKVIIPVYKEMSAYELPVELSKYQAQDMSKIGAVQDLAHGVQRIVGTVEKDAREEAMEALVREKLAKDEEIRRQKEEEKRKEEERKAAEEEKKRKQEAFWKKNKKSFIGGITCILLILASLLLYKSFIEPTSRYKQAEQAAENGDYSTAIEIFADLGSFKDSQSMVVETQIKEAYALLDQGEFNKAYEKLNSINIERIKPSKQEELIKMVEEAKLETNYRWADTDYQNGKYQDSFVKYEQLGDYKDSGTRFKEAAYMYGKSVLEKNSKQYYSDIIEILQPLSEQNYKDSQDLLNEVMYRVCVEKAGEIIEDYEPYYDYLLDINYKDILHYKTIHDTRKSIIGTWEKDGSILVLNIDEGTWYGSERYSFSPRTMTFTLSRDSKFFEAVVSGDTMQISGRSDAFYEGTYHRVK